MNENLFQAQYDLTKKSKLKKFYGENKLLIFSTLIVIIITFISFGIYIENKEKKKIQLANNYIEAKIYLKNGKINLAENILKEVIFSNDSTYSTLALFLMIDENISAKDKEISQLFDHVLKNNKFDKEVKNLIIFKKAVIQANFVSESELLESLNPLINTNTLWKSHALFLLGDYFFTKNEFLKAKEFYSKILSIKDLNKEMYDQARSQLALLIND